MIKLISFGILGIANNIFRQICIFDERNAKMKNRIISLFCTLVLVFTSFAWMIPTRVSAEENENATLISESDIPLMLKYDEETLFENENSPSASMHVDTTDIGWNNWSLPLGNGYFGVNVFGRTETERIQITEKTLSNPWRAPNPNGSGNISNLGGLNNFSETYIDFNHTNSAVTDYERYLDLKTAVSGVSYVYGGVTYTREYFTSYPDKALVIKLDASGDGNLSFTLRPTIPYEQPYAVVEGDKGGKSGTVTSSVENGVGKVVLSGTLEYYDVDFMGIYNVYTDGGTVTASTAQHTYKDTDGTQYTDTDGTIKVSGATSAYIVVTLGTDYELSSETFTTSDSNKPTHTTKMEYTEQKVKGYMNAVLAKTNGKSFADAYATLKSAHVADHSSLFGRATLDLGCDPADFEKMTDDLLADYQLGNRSTYLETLIYQYGRYMLIASSRSGTLPAHLQGAWNTYNIAPWASGYWHNINVQMNYWPAFSTNLAETFESYVQFNNAYMAQAKKYADSIVNQYNKDAYEGAGNNGWTIGVGNTAFSISSDRSPGNAGYTTQLYWDYYRYTQDESILENVVLPVLLEAARFITKCVEKTEDGKYLVSYSDSPEMFVNGVWYYTVGTTYAQSFAYLNNYNVLKAAEELGIIKDNALVSSDSKYAILNTVLEQINLYDPINVGLSGQIKEFREEDYYGSVGDEPNHRHISQLVGLSPGNLINANTPAWLDAAMVTLEGRSAAEAHGWVFAHKVNLYARAFDADNAYAMLNGFIEHCSQNLWSLYNDRIFQAEANFGTTAGIAEMLMQSQNGYIEILPAIPAKWADGTFTGLVAEGNFEVAATWADSLAKTVNIKSNKGGSVSVKYPSIANASVIKASDGKSVSFSVTGKDIITFDTTAGETYIISGFKKVVAPGAPYKLSYTRANFGDFNLAATAVEGAVSYNLYTAVENEPTYTLAQTSSKPHFTYSPTEENKNSRTTFAVTAVNADGVESKRTLCYYNPEYTDADINELYVSYLQNGTLQVIVDANDNASKFKLWEKENGGEYTLVDESIFPLLTYKNYNSDCEYAVSVVSGFDGKESELKPIDSEYKPNNVLLGKKFIPTEETKNNVYIYGGEPLGFDLLTDGQFTEEIVGRFSSSKNGKIDATLDLGATFVLSELKIKLYQGDATVSTGNNPSAFKLYVCSGGKWITVFDGSTMNIEDYKSGSYLVFNLGCVKAEKIRFVAEAKDNKTVTFHEIECSGVLTNKYKDEVENVLSGSTFIPSEETKNNVYNYGGYLMGYDLLTDGEMSKEIEGRFSSTKGATVEATATLDGIYALSEIRIYLYAGKAANAGKSFKLEIYRDGEWLTIFSGDGAAIEKHLVDRYLSFDMGYAAAEKVRFSATALSNSDTVSFYEIEASGFVVKKYEFEELENNVFLGKDFVPTEAAEAQIYNSSYGYANLTEGASARFSTKKGTGLVDATLDLGAVYSLNDLRIRYYIEGSNTTSFVGSAMLIQVYKDGNWSDAIDCKSSTEILSHRDTSLSNFWLSFDLNGVLAEKVRIYVPSTQGSNYSISYYEIECAARKLKENTTVINGENILGEAVISVPTDSVFSDNVLLGKEFKPTDEANSQVYNSNYGYKNLTDGTSNRFSSKSGTGFVDATLDLAAPYLLNNFRIQYYTEIQNNKGEFSFLGTALTIELYNNGIWETVIDCTDNASIAEHKVSDYWLDFDLGGKQAEKIRIYIPSTVSEGSGRSIAFYEIECSGTELRNGTVSTQNTVENLTDGNTDTYLEVIGTGTYSVEIELDRPRALKYLNIYELIDVNNLVNGTPSTASDSTDVEIFTKGTWVKIYDNVPLGDGATSLCMYDVECTKVRITFENTRLFDGESSLRSARISEITCTADDDAIDYTEMKAALDKFPKNDTTSKTYEKFSGYVLDLEATQTEIDAYAAEIDAYCKLLEEVSFVPKTSITLSNALIYNVYVPVCTSLKSFELNGVPYNDISALKDIVTIGENSYYRFQIELPSSDAAKNIILIATVTFGGTEHTVSFTMSVPNYAKKVLERGSAVEKQLARDVLAYIREAYNYSGFASHNTAEEISRVNTVIDSIIGEYYALPTSTGESVKTEGINLVTLNLDAKPTIRFYVSDTTVEFFADGKKLNTKAGTDETYGAYLELDVYAYALCETITYTGGGSYHISSFVDGAAGQPHEALVKAFVKFTESAADYRASVIGSNK